MSEARTFDYDPMVYDTMRELATHLGGLYVQRKRAATTAAERDRWADLVIAVRREVESIDVYDEAAVKAKTAELAERLRRLRVA